MIAGFIEQHTLNIYQELLNQARCLDLIQPVLASGGCLLAITEKVFDGLFCW